MELIKQIQECELQILGFFDKFAKANGITYYMSGGTLLGAVRHQGFIPWDDDVDLMLPREDYERLIDSFQDGRYCLSSCEKDGDYQSPFARLWDTQTEIEWKFMQEKKIGVFIDLFPIDGFPDGKCKSNIHLYCIRFWRMALNIVTRVKYQENEKYVFLKKILKNFFRKNGNEYAIRLNHMGEKFRYEECRYVGVKMTSLHLFREKNNKNIFKETKWLPFENLLLPAPCGYDVYLRHLYGDYMRLPDEQDRHSEHQFIVKFNNGYGVESGFTPE